MAEFRHNPARDAWGILRGFRYQIHHTIVAWLDLADGKELLLEAGEDFDLVDECVRSGDTARLCQQVKHLDAALTLRHASAIEAIGGFHAHRTANPEMDLEFYFLTNTSAGMERESPLGPLAAIDAWNHARVESGKERHRLLSGIASILGSISAKPKRVRTEAWDSFEGVKQLSIGELEEVVNRFSWRMRQPGAENMKETLKKQLGTAPYALDEATAERVLHALEDAVWDAITRPGEKPLTVELRDSLVKAPFSSPESLMRLTERLLGELWAQVQDHERRLQLLEGSAGVRPPTIHAPTVLAELRPDLQPTKATQILGISAIPLTVPSGPRVLAPRRQAVEELLTPVKADRWVHIHGVIGSGKTQLAMLVTREIAGQCYWLSLRDLEPLGAAAYITAALQTGQDPALWVLDDVPRLSGSDGLTSALLEVVRHAEQSSTPILSTSPYTLGEGVLDRLEHSPEFVEAPPLTPADTAAILSQFGAPRKRSAEYVSILTSRCGGSPWLTVASTRWLHRQGWPALDAVLASPVVDPTDADLVRRLRATVPAAEGRELLFRTCHALRPLSADCVRGLAELAPAIQHPGLYLDDLAPWLERSGDLLTASPIVRELGRAEMTASPEAVHAQLASCILENRELRPLDAQAAFAHLTQADRPDAAAALLIMSLRALKEQQAYQHDLGMTLLWRSTPLPTEMSDGLALGLRAVQVDTLADAGEDYVYALDDFLSRWPEATGDDTPWGRPFALATLLETWVPGFGLEYLGLLEDLVGDPLPPAERASIGRMAWARAMLAARLEEVDVWIHALESLSPELIAEMRLCDDEALASLSLADGVWLRQFEADETDLAASARQLERLIEVARENEMDTLRGAAVAARIVVYAEDGRDLEAGNALATRALDSAIGPMGRFLVLQSAGRQFAYHGDPQRGLAYLEQALDEVPEGSRIDVTRVHTLLAASRASSLAGKERQSVAYAERAVRLARTSDIVPVLELAKSLGELGLANHRFGDVGAMADALNEAAVIFTANATDEYGWRDLIVILGHSISYVTEMATRGQPPPELGDGIPFVLPPPGAFLGSTPDRAALFKPETAEMLPVILANLAAAAGDYATASEWAQRGLDTSNSPAVRFSCLGHISSQRIGAGQYLDALNAAQQQIAAMLKDDTSTRREQLEQELRFIVLLPATAHACSRHLSGDQAAVAELADACSTFAAQSAWQASAWTEAASALRNPSSDGIADLAMHLGLVRSALGGTMQPEHVEAHARVALYCESRWSTFHRAYSRYIAPFIFAFWAGAIPRQRFRLRAPNLVDRATLSAAALPERERVRRVLLAVADGLGIRMDEADRAWFQNGSVIE